LKPKGTLLKIKIGGTKVSIRKGTPDLIVAISCLKEFEILRYVLPRDFKGYIVDAGGYIGTAAIAFAKIFPNAQIITIEPSLENLKILKENIKEFKNIRVIYGALIASNEKKVLLKDPNNDKWGFTVINNHLNNKNLSILHETPAFNISSLGINLEDIGILKLDIEGAELDLFRNDSNSLNKINNIIIELHERFVKGCEEAFFKFSKNRIIIKDGGEKYLSIKKEYGKDL
jgi:FkbM family methyltransferase